MIKRFGVFTSVLDQAVQHTDCWFHNSLFGNSSTIRPFRSTITPMLPALAACSLALLAARLRAISALAKTGSLSFWQRLQVFYSYVGSFINQNWLFSRIFACCLFFYTQFSTINPGALLNTFSLLLYSSPFLPVNQHNLLHSNLNRKTIPIYFPRPGNIPDSLILTGIPIMVNYGWKSTSSMLNFYMLIHW